MSDKEQEREPLWSDERITLQYYSRSIELTKAGKLGRKNGANVMELVCREMRDEYEAQIAAQNQELAEAQRYILQLERRVGELETLDLEVVPDGPLCAWAEFDNRTIFIEGSLNRGIQWGYTLKNDEYLMRKRPQPATGDDAR